MHDSMKKENVCIVKHFEREREIFVQNLETERERERERGGWGFVRNFERER